MKVESRDLESLISAILMIGVFASLLVEIAGLGYYITSRGSLEVDFSSNWQTSGKDFFAYGWGTLTSLAQGANPIGLMALGIVMLMITPYVRVLTSVVYFGVRRNPKYALMSLFVLAVLTFSLATH